MKKSSISDLLIYVISAELVGAVSAVFAGGFSDFFVKYANPPLLPPGWLFPVVWVILYAVMGISAYLIHSANSPSSKDALVIYWAQLFVNFWWSIIFFRFEALWAAVVTIAVLWLLILTMIVKFSRIKPLAGKINIPYFIWVTFAAYLNIATAVINTNR